MKQIVLFAFAMQWKKEVAKIESKPWTLKYAPPEDTDEHGSIGQLVKPSIHIQHKLSY